MFNKDYIYDTMHQVEELKFEIEEKKESVRIQIESMQKTLNELKQYESCNCNECGREVSYAEYEEHDGFCKKCINN